MPRLICSDYQFSQWLYVQRISATSEKSERTERRTNCRNVLQSATILGYGADMQRG